MKKRPSSSKGEVHQTSVPIGNRMLSIPKVKFVDEFPEKFDFLEEPQIISSTNEPDILSSTV